MENIIVDIEEKQRRYESTKKRMEKVFSKEKYPNPYLTNKMMYLEKSCEILLMDGYIENNLTSPRFNNQYHYKCTKYGITKKNIRDYMPIYVNKIINNSELYKLNKKYISYHESRTAHMIYNRHESDLSYNEILLNIKMMNDNISIDELYDTAINWCILHRSKDITFPDFTNIHDKFKYAWNNATIPNNKYIYSTVGRYIIRYCKCRESTANHFMKVILNK